jgi:hypothetical protein
MIAASAALPGVLSKLTRSAIAMGSMSRVPTNAIKFLTSNRSLPPGSNHIGA